MECRSELRAAILEERPVDTGASGVDRMVLDVDF
jgi:hypothetical protein